MAFPLLCNKKVPEGNVYSLFVKIQKIIYYNGRFIFYQVKTPTPQPMADFQHQTALLAPKNADFGSKTQNQPNT
jgi:hypothetical protein